MHHALRDALAVEVADLLEELVVLERRRSARPDRALVLVVVDRMPLTVGQNALLVNRGLLRPVVCALAQRLPFPFAPNVGPPSAVVRHILNYTNNSG